jgi:FMN phosphatase YigB (HAD superfamily)
MPGSVKPKVFIGFSSEAEEIAAAIVRGLAGKVDCYPWNDLNAFPPSQTIIESLEWTLNLCSFAVIVLTPDDVLSKRGVRQAVPRDNLLFELGLFIGRHGRGSVFIVLPDGEEISLPSDLSGVKVYRFRPGPEGSPPAVARVCRAIVQAIHRAPPGKTRAPDKPRQVSPFWQSFSDSAVIVYGVDNAAHVAPGEHPRVSPRDLEAAQQVSIHLARCFPGKRISLFPASEKGWQHGLQPDTDLILIGGPLANPELALHEMGPERLFRLKGNRICRVDGQRVYPVAFDPPPGSRRLDPLQWEGPDVHPSEYVSRDFAHVFNVSRDVYRGRRRVIGIAGIRGNGTRGAALFLTLDPPAALEALLKAPLRDRDGLEMVIAVDVAHDAIIGTRLVEAGLNGRFLRVESGESVPCELGRPCQGCTYAELSPRRAGSAPGGVRAIVFDLDDTLLDTFSQLIVPLERRAAEAMIASGAPVETGEALADLLLELRRSHPFDLEGELRRRIPGLSERALAARDAVLAGVSAEGLVPQPGTVALLKELGSRYRLFLLTVGDPRLQNAKIERLGIRDLCHQVIVLDERVSPAKTAALEKLILSEGLSPDALLVVGNRLDGEIRTGNLLRTRTVWIQAGEGSGMQPARETGRPDVSIHSVEEIPQVLARLAG